MGDGINDAVMEKTCALCRENLKAQDDVATKRLDAHAMDIKELTRMYDKLLQLTEIQTKQLEVQSERLNAFEKHLRTLDMETVEDKVKEKIETKENERTFDLKSKVALSVISAFSGSVITLIINFVTKHFHF